MNFELGMFGFFVGVLISLGWAFLLFKIGSSKKNNTALFYSLLYIPIVLFNFVPLLAFIILGSISNFVAFLLLVFVLERLFWGLTLREVAGMRKLGWFFIIFYIPLFGWLIYRVSEL